MSTEVRRPRLLALVDSGEVGGTCHVVAAPGYGASTLLKQVARHRAGAAVYLRLRRGDDLWSRLGQTLPPTPGLDDAGVDPDVVLERIHALGDISVLLDLEGASDVSLSGMDAFRDVVRLAEELPAAARLVVATHEAVDWALPTAHRLLEVSESELAFRLEETIALLPGLDGAEVDPLCEISQGWVAALRAVVAHGSPAFSGSAAWLAGAGAQLLLQKWLDDLPEAQRTFLVNTALLDELTVSACDAVLGRGDSAVILNQLGRAHRFVRESFGGGVALWRRHPVLTALLGRQQESLQGRVERHSRAADHYAAVGDVSATMHHLIGAGRVEDAAAFLRDNESSLFMSGHGAQAVNWFESLPSDSQRNRAMRLLRAAWGQALSGEVADAKVWLARLRGLEGKDTTSIEGRLWLQGETCVLEAYLGAFRGDAEIMATAGERAIDAFGGRTQRDAEQLAYVLRIKGLQWSGDHERAARLLDALRDRTFPNDMIRESSLAGLIVHRLRHEGRIHEAHVVGERINRWLDACGPDPAGERQLRGRGEWAATLVELGELEHAEVALRAAMQACLERGRHGEYAVLLVALARLHRARRELAQALADLRSAREVLLSQSPGSPLLAEVALAEAAVRLDGGDLIRAERIIVRLPPSGDRHLIWARAMVGRGAIPRPALSGINTQNPRMMAKSHLLHAAAQARRNPALAETHLLRAADIAWEHGQALLLLDATRDLTPVAEAAARRHGHDGLSWLLDVTRPPETATPTSPAVPLSRGELELLPLLTGRETVAEISELLGVSPNTTKTRLQRLYRKLDARSRREAIASAQARGLL